MEAPGVLVTSINRKVPLLRALRRSWKRIVPGGLVWGADRNPQVIGRYFVDRFWEAPGDERGYSTALLKHCREHQIRCIVPTRDAELPFFAGARQTWQSSGIRVLVPSLEVVRLCQDKLLFFETLQKRGLPVIPTYPRLPQGLTGTNWVVKERMGAGGRGIFLNISSSEALKRASLLDQPIFQPFREGVEISIDFFAVEGVLHGAILRRRELILGGESQITTSFRHPELERLVARFVEELEYDGHGVLQGILDPKERLQILECNPRIGGASTLSYSLGLDSLGWFFQRCLQPEAALPEFVRYHGEKRLVRYPADRVFEVSES